MTFSPGSLVKFLRNKSGGYRNGSSSSGQYTGYGILLELTEDKCGRVYWTDGVISNHYLTVYELVLEPE